MILRPRRAFETIVSEARPAWFTPMAVLSAAAFLSVMAAGFLTARAASMGEVSLPPDWQYWTPDMQSNFMQAQQAMQGPTFLYVIPLVASLSKLWLGWLILSGLLHLGSTLLGGRGSMQGALTLTAWALLPFALRDVLRVIFMLLTRHVIASPGLSGFATGPAFLSQVLSHVDVFLIWSTVLLVIGFGLGDDLPKNKAAAGVAVVMLILLLALAGVGTLGANMGGMAVQRPFF